MQARPSEAVAVDKEAPTPPIFCRVPTREEQEAFAREFPEWCGPMPAVAPR